MAFRRVTCVIAVCDVCGSSQDPDGGEVHFETEADALEFALGDPDQLPDTWYQRADGRLVCWRRNALHDQTRETDAHYKPGRDPWGVHFTEVDDYAQNLDAVISWLSQAAANERQEQR